MFLSIDALNIRNPIEAWVLEINCRTMNYELEVDLLDNNGGRDAECWGSERFQKSEIWRTN